MTLDDAELDFLAQNMHILSPEEAAEVEVLIDELEKRRSAKACRDDLIECCKKIQEDYKLGKNHRMRADEQMALTDANKDQLVSIYFPAWFIGKYPNKKILMVSHTSDLAVDFGRKVRNIIDSPTYKEIFPTVRSEERRVGKECGSRGLRSNLDKKPPDN